MRASRRYPLPAAALFAALLAPVVALGPAAAVVPGPAAAVVPAGPAGAAPHLAGTAASGTTPERVTRLALGGFREPAPGVRHTAQPAGVPLAEEVRPAARGAASPPALVLRRPVTPPFSAVAVTWAQGRRPADVSVAVRVRRATGWTRWRAAGPDEGGREATRPEGRRGPPGLTLRDAAELQWWGPARGLEIAVTAIAGDRPADVAVDLIDPGELPGDALAAAQPAAGAPAVEGAESGGSGPGGGPARPDGAAAERVGRASPYLPQRVRMPAIVRRSGWGANERKMRWTPEYVPWLKAATVHHTATTNSYTAAQVPRILRSIYHFHAVSRGWGDIGYNVLVDRFGRLWEGRAGGLSRPVVGAHSGGYNSYTTGVSFLGDHRRRGIRVRSREAAARFLAWKFALSPAFDPRGRTRLIGGGSTSKYPPGTTISVARVHGHRRTNATSCPGARGVAALAPLRRRTNVLMGIWTRPRALRTRLTVWRPSTARWYVRGTTGAVLRGAVGDLPAAADFDGDGTTDLATWTPATGRWVIRYTGTRRVVYRVLGRPGHRPVPIDTNGDGRAEPVTWDPATGRWFRQGKAPRTWGRTGDVPLPGDYSGDGRADLAFWRPSTGRWHIRGVATVALGNASHVPVPADYDGDGDLDPATWSPVTRRFYVFRQATRYYGTFGQIPVPGQYDGDAPAELAIWGTTRGRSGWLIQGLGVLPLGTEGDQPIPAR